MKTLMNKIMTIFLSYVTRHRKNYSLARIAVITILLSAIMFTCLIASGCAPKEKAVLYFAKYEDNSSYLAPETRLVIKDENFYKTILEELIKGPGNEQLYPTLPTSVKVNSVKIDGNLAIADFSKEIITDNSVIPHSSTTEILAIFSIVDTLTEFDEIQKVRITVDGKMDGQIDGLHIQDFWGHVGIYEDFSRNEEILTKNLN